MKGPNTKGNTKNGTSVGVIATLDRHYEVGNLPGTETLPSMFNQFTDRARKIIALAQKAAERFRHDYIGPEHLLLGLVDENTGMAVTALSCLGVTCEMVQREIDSLVVIGTQKRNAGPLPFTPQAKHILERASEEAQNLGHPYVGTEHIMLGIISDQKSIATSVLSNLGISADKFRKEILELLGQKADSSKPKPINHVILMTTAAKTYIYDAIDRMNKDPKIFPALVISSGFKVGSEGDDDYIEYHGKCFGMAGYAEINQGFFPITILDRKVLIHEMVMSELNGKILDLVAVINIKNGVQTQIMKAIYSN